jgi:subtilisin family serine protease
MRRLGTTATLAVLIGSLAGATQAGEIELNLQAVMAGTGQHETVSALVYLSDRVDLAVLEQQFARGDRTLRHRHEVVVTALRERAAATQPPLQAFLDSFRQAGTVTSYQPFWIANCIRVEATPAAIEAIAAHPDVDIVYLNYPIEATEPVQQPPDQKRPNERDDRSPEPGVVAVRAPEVWAMGFTGTGILVATLDTGVDGNHPALASRWRGVADPRYADNPEWAWFDPVTNTNFPTAFGSHGTHTMGTVCGGPPGDEIGVAPGAQWIHAGVIDRVSIEQTVADALLAFQWLLDPDEDPATNWDVPQVCSNSWRVTSWHGYAPCDDTFWAALDACEAAGIVILFSAGNEGPSPETIGRPPDRATDDYRCFAVGAVNGNVPSWPIAEFSSRGPSYCTPGGDVAIKPEIVAPGVEVRSSVPGGGYEWLYWSGTSMASPHVNGAVALVREACPDLSVEEVKQVLLETAHDLGPSGDDNDYGMGMLDAYEAVNLALSLCSGAPRARDGDYETPVDTPVLVTLEASDYDGLPDPPGALTYIVTSLPTPGNTLADVGNGHVIEEADLPYALVDYGNQLTYTPTGGYYGTDTFEFMANDGGVPPDGGDSNIATVSILVLFDAPVITTEFLPSGLLNGLYGPVQLEADGGQPELEWLVLTAGEYFETDLGSSLFTEVGTARGWHADDSTWSYSLPFTFPFYGGEYNSVYVCSNGFIDFTSSSSDYSNSDAELIAAVRIAPLWDDLKTYSPSDIYIDESVPGQVTIRWAAVTYSGDYPCNFSITLFEDGLIQFHYGTGNTGLSPTIGISSGDGTHYLLTSYNNASSLTNANSLELMRPAQLPEGIELSPDGVLSGIPTELGIFNPTFRVTDSLGRSDQRELELEINSGPVPPIASDQSVSTPVNTPVTITLVANDDGLPDPPAAITYIIDSLPAHGSLSDPGAGAIDSVPYTLAGGGNQVDYAPTVWYVGSDTFTFLANDGGEPPDGGDSNVANIEIEVLPPEPEAAFSFSLDSDPGWTTEGQWAFGQPTGGGSHAGDPDSGYTGSNVYGYNLSGDYPNDMPEYALTTTAINCRDVQGAELRFWRWLGVERWDRAAVKISNNGTDWTTLWSNPTDTTLSDSSWNAMTFDIAGIADGQPTVYLRWTMGPTDDGITYPGWNIDDVEIWGMVIPQCPGDLDGDSDIDLADLAELLAHYGMSGAGYGDGDLDGDGDVDLADLAALLAVYGTTCP